ncbi:MAG: AmmeMemoRadiSam system protein B [Deltaproteobacteria bacterium]|nr:AmmeMemoRadiSam system protein B [Candidatus Zymogenaceae bacterium]
MKETYCRGRILIFFLAFYYTLIFLAVSACAQDIPDNKSKVRPPAVAGAFYPDDANDLRAMIEQFLAEAPAVTVGGRSIAVIAPHAGYIYSGKTAAAGFKALAGTAYDTVIIIGPSHHYSFDGAALYADGPYRTPLGDVILDADMIDSIVKSGEHITKNPLPHLPEHSVEVEIPFLQVVLGDFAIVPVVMGSVSMASCEELARAISESVGGKKVLIVASSDLSHYHSRKEGRELDGVFRNFLEKNDPEGLYDALITRKTEACGGGPVVTALMAARALGSTRVVVTKYDDSGTETGTTGAVVGYISAVVYGRGGPPAGMGDDPGTRLTAADKKKLLAIARKTIECELSGKDIPDFTNNSAALSRPGAAFVTLTNGGELRGCVGYIEPVYPLFETISLAALGAVYDLRFYLDPVTKEELKEIDIEISVLSELKPIKSVDEIVIGKHGLVIRRGGRSGLFLPQVPVEQGWDLDEYLEKICYKAGLMPGDWKKEDARLSVFTADVFSEE